MVHSHEKNNFLDIGKPLYIEGFYGGELSNGTPVYPEQNNAMNVSDQDIENF